MMAVRGVLRRWHFWLAWVVGVPVLLWTASGLVMVAKPIAEVRGEGLLRPAATVRLAGPVRMPAIGGLPVTSLRLEQRADGPRWVARLAGLPGPRSADPVSGRWLPPLGAAEAAREVSARYTGEARVATVSRVTRDQDLTELASPIDGWRVRMSDATHFFVDAGSGEVVATRTRFWRFYDLMWGLHIMDLKGRDNPHNPWVIMFAALSLAMVLLGLALLPMSGPLRRPPATPARRADRSVPPSPPA